MSNVTQNVTLNVSGKVEPSLLAGTAALGANIEQAGVKSEQAAEAVARSSRAIQASLAPITGQMRGVEIRVSTPGAADVVATLQRLGASEAALANHSAIAKALASNASDRVRAAYIEEAKALDKLRESEIKETETRQKAANLAAVHVSETHIGGSPAATSAAAASLANIERTANAGVQALTEKAGQLAQSIGGVTGQLADVAVKAVAGYGPAGLAITGMTAALGFALTASQEHNAALERTRVTSESVAAASITLGASYASVAEAARAATTAEEARVAVAREVAAITAAQVDAVGAGFSRDEARDLTAGYQNISRASRIAGTDVARFTVAQVEHAVVSGNMAEQLAVLGVAIERSSNAAVEHSNVLRRTAEAAREAARSAAQHAHEQTQSRDVNQSSLGALQALATSSRALATARTELTRATEAGNAVDQHQLDIQREIEAQRISALRASDRARDAAATRDELDKHKAHLASLRAAALAAPSASEQRASIEALRLAREANDNRFATIDIDDQLAAAQRALAHATSEVDIAQRRASDGHHTSVARRQELTQALSAQTAAQQQLTAAMEAETEAGLAREQVLRNRRLQWLMADPRESAEQATRASGAANAAVAGIGRLNEPADVTANADRSAAMTESLQQQELAEVEKGVLASRLSAHESFTGRMIELQGEQASGSARLAEFTNAAFQSVGKALANHVAAWAAGKESIGVALQGILADTLTAIGQEAMVRGAFEVAQGVGALAGIVTAGLAPGHFAAGAAYLAVGALATAGGAALAPAPSVPAGGAGGAGGVLPDRASGSGEGGLTIVENNYAPRFGGREGGAAEVGQRMDRFTRAEARRTSRAA